MTFEKCPKSTSRTFQVEVEFKVYNSWLKGIYKQHMDFYTNECCFEITDDEQKKLFEPFVKFDIDIIEDWRYI